MAIICKSLEDEASVLTGSDRLAERFYCTRYTFRRAPPPRADPVPRAWRGRCRSGDGAVGASCEWRGGGRRDGVVAAATAAAMEARLGRHRTSACAGADGRHGGGARCRPAGKSGGRPRGPPKSCASVATAAPRRGGRPAAATRVVGGDARCGRRRRWRRRHGDRCQRWRGNPMVAAVCGGGHGCASERRWQWRQPRQRLRWPPPPLSGGVQGDGAPASMTGGRRRCRRWHAPSAMPPKP